MNTETNERINKLLNILSDGEFHSGQYLADTIGVSRTAVWKLIAKFQSWQIDVYSVKGKGYKIPGGLDLIDKKRLTTLVSRKLKHFPNIELQTTIDSTSSYISNQWRKNSKNAPVDSGSKGSVCIAEHQTEGRGRKGNKWVSPFGANLYFSLGIELPVGLSVLGGLSLAIGIGLTEYLNKITSQQVKLKWPNDLLCDNKKIAGILVEASGDSTDTSFINVGIGINWNMPIKFAEGISQPWINLKEILPASIDRTELMSNLLIELDKTIESFILEGFELFNKRWSENSAFIGKKILIKSKLGLENNIIEGVEQGIDKNGAIRVLTEQGEKSFYSGEVSLRVHP